MSDVTAHLRLADVFDRGFRDGVETLSPTERDLYRIQEFILSYEISGLSGHFFNWFYKLEEVLAAVAAMERQGLPKLAALVAEAAAIFAGQGDPEPGTTWSELVQRLDPSGRLEELDQCISALDEYGLGDSDIK